MTGRIVGGIAGDVTNFGMFEGMKEAESQFVHGGKAAPTDENSNFLREVRYVEHDVGAVCGFS